MQYDLSHLIQEPSQAVLGPIQDDEALLLFAVCRVTCARRIAEFGGESGYSARNFLAAVRNAADAVVYTVDRNPVPQQAPNHRLIQKSAQDVCPDEFDGRPLDLVLFDCHDFAQQLQAFQTLSRSGVISQATSIALHDTGTHPQQYVPWAFRGVDGFIHQPAERDLVSYLQDHGYECLSFHAPQPAAPLQFRHGLTLCRSKHRLLNIRLDE